MTCLLDLSHELLHNILVFCDPADLGVISQTCSALNSYLKGNRLLCKELYLNNWDHPAARDEPCWERELRKLVGLQKVLECDDIEQKRTHLKQAASTIAPLLQTSRSRLNVPFLAAHFTSQANIDAFLAASSLFKRAGSASQTPADTEDLRQLSAKLHCLYGKPIDAPSDSVKDEVPGLLRQHEQSYILRMPPAESSVVTRSQTKCFPTNTFARAKVYDLRQYTEPSLWGPFKDDWSADVDWEKMEAVMVVLGYNLRSFAGRSRTGAAFTPLWDTPWQGVAPGSFVSPPVPPAAAGASKLPKDLGCPGGLDARDPYGITGIWMRVVCFLDYHDLYAFNFARPPPAIGQPREPIDTREAIRMIKLKLRVTKIEPPGEDDGQDLPVVTFRGTSWSMHSSWDPNANSKIRGVVRQTREGEVRWTTWSIFHGEERWRSEGIQVGGPKSARGVLGNWFDKDYDIHGPAGPTAFWKVTDDVSDPSLDNTTSNFGNIFGLTVVGFANDDEEEDDDGDDDDGDGASGSEDGDDWSGESEVGGVGELGNGSNGPGLVVEIVQ